MIPTILTFTVDVEQRIGVSLAAARYVRSASMAVVSKSAAYAAKTSESCYADNASNISWWD